MTPHVIKKLALLLLIAVSNCGISTVIVGINAYCTMIRSATTSSRRRILTDPILRHSRSYASLQLSLNQKPKTSPYFRHNAFLGSDYNVFSSSSLPQQQQELFDETILTTTTTTATNAELDDVVVAAEVQLPSSSTPSPPIAPPPPAFQPKMTTTTPLSKPKPLNGSTKPKKITAVASRNHAPFYDDDDRITSSSQYDDNHYEVDSNPVVALSDPNSPRSKFPPNRAEYDAARYPPLEVVNSVYDYNTIDDYLVGENIRSRPKPDGNWNVEDPVGWAKDFGRRSPQYDNILRTIIQLQPGDDKYFPYDDNFSVPETTIVRTKEQALIVMNRLMNADPNIVHGCDTEVMDIDLKSVGPVGNGYCTCVSIYSGPDFDYGLGQGPGSTLWIDNLDDACGLLQEFKPWFESEKFKKVWHNYGFDRHILWNEGIDLRGFWGDTMHMARLQDSSRAKTAGAGGYGLDALTKDLLDDAEAEKVSMKDIFGVKRLRKDGSEGSLTDIPPVEVLQRDPNFRAKWIMYSAKDARSTWMLREKLTELLKQMSWIKPDTNMYDYYELHMRPFGEVLTDMERRGIRVDAKDYLASVEIQAREDREHHVNVFRQWAAKQIGGNGLALNTASSTQLCTFLFGGAKNQKTGEQTEFIREFKVPRDEIPEDALEAFRLEEEAANRKDTSDGEFFCISTPN